MDFFFSHVPSRPSLFVLNYLRRIPHWRWLADRKQRKKKTKGLPSKRTKLFKRRRADKKGRPGQTWIFRYPHMVSAASPSVCNLTDTTEHILESAKPRNYNHFQKVKNFPRYEFSLAFLRFRPENVIRVDFKQTWWFTGFLKKRIKGIFDSVSQVINIDFWPFFPVPFHWIQVENFQKSFEEYSKFAF